MESDADSEPELKVELSADLSREERKRLRRQWKEKNAIKKLKKKQKQEAKKAKLSETNDVVTEEPQIDTSEAPKGRNYTLSIAVAGSILDNAQSQVLRAYLAGQIARAAAVFNVDEIIVFDDTGGNAKSACEQMARILQFMECPQYLRKYLFPLHPDLQYSGVVSPLDIPHHLRKDEILPYREGAVANRPHKEGKGSYVYIGLEKDVRVDKDLPENTRVTVKLDDPNLMLSKKGKLKGKLVSPQLPTTEAGIYWGYTVRIANSISDIFSKCPFKEGKYDVTIGTSEKGSLVSDLSLPKFKRLLVVFGGVEGLEYAFESDETTIVSDVSDMFQHYVNTCPAQGSRTIRTEEAILISLAALAPVITLANPK